MNEPDRIAAILVEEAFATPAAILVALIADERLEVLPEDLGHLGPLQRMGCIDNFAPTPLGQRVGMVLRATHGLEPWPSPPETI